MYQASQAQDALSREGDEKEGDGRERNWGVREEGTSGCEKGEEGTRLPGPVPTAPPTQHLDLGAPDTFPIPGTAYS